jgi:nitrite reductase/ring-hydroxylating ferredoxin subunit
VTAGEVHTITRARKTVIEVDGYEVLVLAHDGNLHAFQNRCIHKQRELAKGVVLNGKLVCPGHQWAFALDSGWEAIKEECHRCSQCAWSMAWSGPGSPRTSANRRAVTATTSDAPAPAGPYSQSTRVANIVQRRPRGACT